MSKYFKTLLLLAAGLMILSPIAMAQEAMSPILPAPWTSRVGSQLVYYYEDGVTTAARGEYRSFLTVTNTNITTYVMVHVQVYTQACDEYIDFVDILTPADTHIYDPRGFKRDITDQLAGSATNGRFIVTITPIDVHGEISDRRAIAFNHLTGQIWTSHFGQSATWMTNAIPRMAVNRTGSLMAEAVEQVGSAYFGTSLTLDGRTRMFQVFRPDIMALNRFFAPKDLHQPVPSGNRLTFVSIRDDYEPADNTYRIRSYSQRLDSLLFDDEENVFSVPPQTVVCYVDFVVGFDTSGNFTNFIGSAATPVIVSTGGWIRIRPAYATECSDGSCSAPGSIWGSFAQSLGTFGGGDLLIGIGRRKARIRCSYDDADTCNIPILYEYVVSNYGTGSDDITIGSASATVQTAK